MFSQLIRRVAFSAAVAGFAAFAAGPAFADSTAENYVQVNAGEAIAALGATGSASERSAKFGQLMEEFSDLPALTDFVLGVYARSLRANPALQSEWSEAFRAYAMATYEDQLDKYRGSTLKVLGSRDSVKNDESCSRVGTRMTNKKVAPLTVYWYLCRPLSGGQWKVADVGLVMGDSEVKLAITTRDQFVTFLGANGGDIHRLISRVRTQTAVIKARMNGKRSG